MDDPEMILNGALENHYKMINEFKESTYSSTVLHQVHDEKSVLLCTGCAGCSAREASRRLASSALRFIIGGGAHHVP
jgi:hypothetical protein